MNGRAQVRARVALCLIAAPHHVARFTYWPGCEGAKECQSLAALLPLHLHHLASHICCVSLLVRNRHVPGTRVLCEPKNGLNSVSCLCIK